MTYRLASLVIEAQKKRVKTHFDQTVHPRSFVEGDLVLLYDQANDKVGAGKFEHMWHGPYIVKHVLQKGAYEMIDYEGNPLDKPRNGLYLKNIMHESRHSLFVYTCAFSKCVVCACFHVFALACRRDCRLLCLFASWTDVLIALRWFR